ncbi:Lar family restriction alleviation protein [Pectobacterium carotovorum]|uniref:Lar family restriction alleviation protein n=1 Tax=Pectobacterium carotovorum TaxID=554 RepID=UPI0021F2FBAE|nr:Lar family restriction alleviation protein [Pectobacterium carotovorum]
MTDLLSKERLEHYATMPTQPHEGKAASVFMYEVRRIAREALQRREAAEKPFMYGIADPDGKAHFDEFCVSADYGMVDDAVSNLNYDREDGDELNYSVVALYRDYPLTSAERERLNGLLDDYTEQLISSNNLCSKIHGQLKEANERLAAYDGAAKEPVYQYQSGICNDENGETDWYWDDCDKGFYDQYAADRRRILYAAPPMPVVPDKKGLLPCPFCGCKADFDYDDSGYEWISCNSCGVSTDTAIHTDNDAKDILRKMWNRRAAMLQAG